MAPLLNNKNPTAKSVFSPSALLREARRQKGLATENIPSICFLAREGYMVRLLKATGKARLANDWPVITRNYIRSHWAHSWSALLAAQ